MDDEVHEVRPTGTWRRKRQLWSGPRRLRRTLSQAEFADLMVQQACRCAICCAQVGWGRYRGDSGEPESTAKPAAVDRSPDGVVRGLLCGSCVRALGLFADDLYRLVAAVRYLAAAAAARAEQADPVPSHPSAPDREASHGAARDPQHDSGSALRSAQTRSDVELVLTTRSGRQLDLRDASWVAQLRTDPEVAEALDAYIARAAASRGG